LRALRRDDARPDRRLGEIQADLKSLGASLYCLTNFSAETYPPTFERFEFLRWFRGVLVSGEVGVIKPDPRIFELLLERFAIDPKRAVYIDDVAANVGAARRFGIHAIRFTTPATLRAELAELGILPSQTTLFSR
jgi:2-haloacid dehalogenase